MRAITIAAPGGPDQLVWSDVPDPEPGPGEVLIEITASAVNRADILQRQGFYHPPPGASPYPGLECSGHIRAVGAGVTGFVRGDAVCALLAGGGYAQKVVVPAGQVVPAPTRLTLQEAGGLMETACTVWANVFQLARLTAGETLLVHGGASGIGSTAIQLAAGETLLVHGGASGIGSTAIQLAHELGARVITTAGSPEKLAFCRDLGADVTVNYRTEDFVERVRDETGGHGADVILDNMGAAYLDRNVTALAVNGRLVVIGLQGGVKGELNLGTLLAKRGTVHATSLRARPAAEKAAIVAATQEALWPLIETGRFRVVVDRVIPMAEAGRAHQVVEAGEHMGKVILDAEHGRP